MVVSVAGLRSSVNIPLPSYNMQDGRHGPPPEHASSTYPDECAGAARRVEESVGSLRRENTHKLLGRGKLFCPSFSGWCSCLLFRRGLETSELLVLIVTGRPTFCGGGDGIPRESHPNDARGFVAVAVAVSRWTTRTVTAGDAGRRGSTVATGDG
jgi:hypothetical protein